GAELGIEPSPSLSAQHAELLAGAGVAAWAAVDRLPVPATSLIGRDELAADVVRSLGAHRVVTLVGPGGVGKTRLAVDVGHRLLAARPERPVVMGELAPATAASAVDTVSEALRIDVRPGVSTIERVAAVVGDSDVVVVLDNCEHVLEPIAELVDHVIAHCPRVTVLATSRERLRVPGEQVLAVPSLPGDEEGPAVQLFLERARAVAPDFAPAGAELTGVAEIVRRLDGLPLAIELAAARLHTHDVVEVAAGLDRRFALLTSGSRASSRHGSLGAAVSWSFGLLDEQLQRTFTEVSVFVGPFTAADAAAVCGADQADVAEALTQLVERSLVMRVPGRRYVLLETLRAFGAEQLVATGRVDELGGHHARHQVDWLERTNQRLFADGFGTTADIDAVVPELRAALDWMLANDQIEVAGRLVTALLDYGLLRQRPDVLAWAARVVEADPADESPWAAHVWVAAGYAAWLGGSVAETSVRARRALELSEASGGPVPPRVAVLRGNIDLFGGRLDTAVTWYQRGIDAAGDDACARMLAAATELLARGYAGDPTVDALADRLLTAYGAMTTPYAAYVWYCAGEADLATGVVERARDRLTKAIEVAEVTGTSFVTGLAGASRASLDARLGDPLAAAEDYRRLIGHWRRAGVWSTQWTMLRSVAALLERLGRARDAAVLEGAVRATTAGPRIVGADEAALAELGRRLR
ncbi:MAG TPA: hypothetical protein VFT09_04590, partial [Ilumatobacteraceae bacterium]|nr:hypothetical protein [Ilumatobacteraceae bacterium]